MTALPNKIREFRESRGWSMAALGERAGTSAQQIEKLEKGQRKLTLDWMVRVAKALGVHPKELVPEHTPGAALDTSKTSRIISELPASLGATPVDFGPADLPVYGKAEGGPRGVLIIPAEPEPVDMTYRPAQLRGVGDAFAIYVTGESMHPMFKSGQTLWIHPHLPRISGEGVLIVKLSDEAIVKEFVSESDAGLTVLEYRPKERKFTIPWSEIRRAYRVIGALSLR